MKFHVVGLSEAINEFKNLAGEKALRTPIRRGLKKAANLMHDSAVTAAPVRMTPYPPSAVRGKAGRNWKARNPGNLVRGINVKSLKSRKGRFGLRVTAGVRYAAPLEAGGKVNRSPRPFMKPAFVRHQHEAFFLVKDEIDKALQKVIRKINRAKAKAAKAGT